MFLRKIAVLTAFLLFTLAAPLVFAEEREPTQRNGLYLSAGAGFSTLINAERNALTQGANKGVEVNLSVMTRLLPWLEMGFRAGFLSTISTETDAQNILGFNLGIETRFVVDLNRWELFIGPDLALTYLHRKVDYINANQLTFLSPTIGLLLGVNFRATDIWSIGLISRFGYIFNSYYCAENECGSPYVGRNPGQLFNVGISGTFHIPMWN